MILTPEMKTWYGMIATVGTLGPVSYTHLDVYKRQPLRPTISSASPTFLAISAELSERIFSP